MSLRKVLSRTPFYYSERQACPMSTLQYSNQFKIKRNLENLEQYNAKGTNGVSQISKLCLIILNFMGLFNYWAGIIIIPNMYVNLKYLKLIWISINLRLEINISQL